MRNCEETAGEAHPRVVPAVWWVTWIVLCVIHTCWMGSVGWAQSEIPVVDLLPPDSPKGAARVTLSGEVGHGVALLPPAPKLVEALRWASPDKARQGCLAEAPALMSAIADAGVISPPEDVSRLHQALVTQAAELILYMDLQGVLSAIREAEQMLPCVDELLTQDEVRSLFLHAAVAHIYLEDGEGSAALARMLAADHPRVFLETDYPPNVQNAYLEVVKNQMRSQPLRLDLGGLEGEVYLDGRPVDALGGIRPGSHVLQLRGPGGAIRSRLLEITDGQAPEGVLWLSGLTKVGLATSVEARSGLSHRLASQTLLEAEREILDDYLSSVGETVILFAVKGPSGPALRIYGKGEGLISSLPDGFGRTAAQAASSRSSTGQEPSRTSEVSAGQGSKDADAPPSGLDIGLGLGLQTIRGDAYRINGRSSGYVLRVTYPVGRLLVGVRGTWMARVSSRVDGSDSCGTYDGETEPSEAQVAEALSCVTPSPTWGGALGAAYHMPLGRGLRMAPGLYLEAQHLPNMLLSSDGLDSSLQLATVTQVGAMVRTRFDYTVLRLGSGARLELEIEPAFGLLFGGTSEASAVGGALGLTLGAGMLF